MIPPFDYPEIKLLFRNLLSSLLEESSRGAVLIGAEHIDSYLTQLLGASLPNESSKYHKMLFEHTGLLSSFSAKIELAYAFRFIPKTLYQTLNCYRKIRNDAAHSATPFLLSELKDAMSHVYDLGPGFPTFIRNGALTMIVKEKIAVVNEILSDNGASDDFKAGFFEKFKTDKEIHTSIEEQALHWELVLAVTFICGYLAYLREKTTAVLKDKATWSSLSVDSKTE